MTEEDTTPNDPLDQTLFILEAEQWDAFVAALTAPVKENVRLRRLIGAQNMIRHMLTQLEAKPVDCALESPENLAPVNNYHVWERGRIQGHLEAKREIERLRAEVESLKRAFLTGKRPI